MMGNRWRTGARAGQPATDAGTLTNRDQSLNIQTKPFFCVSCRGSNATFQICRHRCRNADDSAVSNGAGQARGLGFAIRGVGTVTFGDDVVPGRPGQGIADLADVAQVEVLREPQGMLFGRNASRDSSTSRRIWTTRSVTPTGFIGLTQLPQVTALSVPLLGSLRATTTGGFRRSITDVIRDSRTRAAVARQASHWMRGSNCR